MNQIDYGSTNPQSRQDLMLLKLSFIGCGLLLSIGLLVFTIARFQSIAKTSPEQPKPGEVQKNLTTPTQPSEQSPIVIKKSQSPIVIEEQSEAWFCIQNNGGSGCLTRDRFAPNYKVIAPPRPQKSYEDYLVQYRVRSDDCGRYLNGQPNCI
ncbi:hypothetical protein [Planktothrix sp.]|uniref:hypothetical protein n=1 Tax=Planktothrix sp. TaxID=3088171 RepID=UPI0038D39A5F